MNEAHSQRMDNSSIRAAPWSEPTHSRMDNSSTRVFLRSGPTHIRMERSITVESRLSESRLTEFRFYRVTKKNIRFSHSDLKSRVLLIFFSHSLDTSLTMTVSYPKGQTRPGRNYK
ncbi:hypothetical protein AVEN_56027-1 [Araneus ventricosus]|uniref:Uncharacterized protein n=1 Tax=Araneus ventricosus TaxID=182803 RepID=A0A4Y2DQ18_ARAVE|nr:hypothetical protein AVEN_56027-1 [Araneus ventricosus]